MDFSLFFSGFGNIFSFHYISYMFLGVSFGMILGFLPGLSGPVGLALLIPFTFKMKELDMLVLMLSIYTGAIYGGAITAITINTPGAPSNIATVLDGYPMSKKGQTERALGISLGSSAIGGIFGCTILLLLAEPIANVALKFGYSEMFMVGIFGISVVGSLANDFWKALYAGAFGILLGTVGTSQSGVIRGTMGIIDLMDGFPMIPVLVGLIALPELVEMITGKAGSVVISKTGNNLSKIIHGMFEPIKRIWLTLVNAVIGTIVGILPAAGAQIAGMLSYNLTKQFSKKSESFGTGIEEGIIAPETANNASEGGALATMFVLGIPGSTATALILAALELKGWLPGPRLFLENKEVIYTAFSSLFMQQFVMLIVGMFMCVLCAKIVRVPKSYLVPSVVVFATLGAFSNKYVLFDCILLIIFGVLGWFMKKYDFPVLPAILGYILGGILDNELTHVMAALDSFWYIFQSPIVVVLLILSILCFVLPRIMNRRREKRKSSN